MKKLLALLLVLVMCFSLVACGESKKDKEDKKDDKEPTSNSQTEEKVNPIKAYMDENGDEVIAGFNQGFSGSGMTANTTYEVDGDTLILNIRINELENVTAEMKEMLQQTYDSMKDSFQPTLTALQEEVPEVKGLNFNVCDKNGEVLAKIELK